MHSIAIIGSGPTSIYTTKHLLDSARGPVSVTIFESQAQAGKGMPYHPDWNNSAMLANIASIELPPVKETLLEWLTRQTDNTLETMGVARNTIDERAFFPRVVLGEYYHDQMKQLIKVAQISGHDLILKTSSPVDDVIINQRDICIAYRCDGDYRRHARFDTVVLATGHQWPEHPEIRRGYFLSPWPVTALESIGNCHVGIRGTSLSAIDAAIALSTARGKFLTDENGSLCYEANPGTDGFRMTCMSRKGLLPEADFYHPIPYEPLKFCTREVVEALIAKNYPDLLDRTFTIFKRELELSSPEYASAIKLENLGLENFCEAYFKTRQNTDPFVWAEQNLAEAIRNQSRKYTVPWRYAILRMHEVVALIAPHLTAEDYARFSKYLKPVFVDDYATVPHESIERMLALYRAEKLCILAIGEDYKLDTHCSQAGAKLQLYGEEIHFPAFIEAMGQRTLSAREFPFPSLRQQGVIKDIKAYSLKSHGAKEIGGIALDSAFRPVSSLAQARNLYCLSLPFMLGQYPFAQGITSSNDMGQKTAQTIIDQIHGDKQSMPVTDKSEMTEGRVA